MKKQNFLRVCIFLISPIVLKLKAIENFFFNFFLDFFENFWFFEKNHHFHLFFEEASKWSSWWNFEALMGFRVSKRIYLDQGMYFSNFHHCAWPLARTGNPATYRFVVRASVDDPHLDNNRPHIGNNHPHIGNNRPHFDHNRPHLRAQQIDML